jgi:transcriptional regulator of acetoin/glycerol metabolism
MSEQLAFIQPLEVVAEEHMLTALKFFGWNITRAAKALEIDRRTLYRAMQKNGWKRPNVQS